MLVLLLLLWLLCVWARDSTPPKDTKYTIKANPSCPDVGYYFQSESNSNALTSQICYLCFCQKDGTAVCWRRDTKICDVNYHHVQEKRESRVRRSPLGFGDLFFRDATRDLFNKQIPQTCKPYETSFSEGCPPDDWCTGCTVCDCDAHGRWDCHILSFCPDKDNSTLTKKNKKFLKSISPKRTTLKPKTSMTPNRTTPKAKKASTKIKKMNSAARKSIGSSALKVPKITAKKPLFRKNSKELKQKRKFERHQTTQKAANSPTPLIKQKDLIRKKLIVQKKGQNQIFLNSNETTKITQEVYKRVATAVQKMIANKLSASVQEMNKLKKRSMEKTQPCQKKTKKTKKYMGSNKNQYKKVSQKNRGDKKHNKKIKRRRAKTTIPPENRRIKREISRNVTKTGNLESPLIMLPNVTTIDSNIYETNYYKYSVVTPELNSNTTDKVDIQIVHGSISNDGQENKLQKNYDIINKQTIEQNASNIVNSTKRPLENIVIPIDNISDINNLHLNKWAQFKVPRNRLLFDKSLKNNITNPDMAPQINTRPIMRLVVPGMHNRKQNKSKIIKTVNTKPRNFKSIRPNTTLIERLYKKFDNIQNLLQRLINEFRKNKAMKTRPKRYNIIKYLKKFFRKLFQKRKGNVDMTFNNKSLLNQQIIDMICDNFGECNIKIVNSTEINRMIKELYTESFDTLKYINIIKGLLYLLNFSHAEENKALNARNRTNFKDDVLKLHAILKDPNITSSRNLTDTEITQITYLKNNVQLFIKSVGKFASKLKDIINILTKKDSDAVKLHLIRRARENTNVTNKQRNSLLRQNLGHEYVKALLEKYTTKQDAIAQSMYESFQRYNIYQDDKIKTLLERNKNATVYIVRYADKITSNLRKLKKLADGLSSGHRRKRNVLVDDDAMEYMLTVMEFLLKQNNPLESVPVNDGIDLLIEAIKTAPDVKPLNKTVLQYLPVKNDVPAAIPPVIMLREDTSPKTNKTSKELKNTIDARRTAKTVNGNAPEDQSENIEDKNVDTRFEKYNDSDTTATPLFKTNVEKEVYKSKEHKVDDTTEHNNFEKFEKAIKDPTFENKKIKVFIADDDDDESDDDVTSTTHGVDVNESVTTAEPVDTTEYKADVKDKEIINNIDRFKKKYGEKRVFLNWLDEDAEIDTGEVKSNRNDTNTEVPIDVTTKIMTKSGNLVHADNISSITMEGIDEEDKNKNGNLNIEDLMYKKQMDLLNSLDYGSEKAETFEAHAKDEEKYHGDVYSSYF